MSNRIAARAPLALLLVLVTAAVGGCAGSTVSGHGVLVNAPALPGPTVPTVPANASTPPASAPPGAGVVVVDRPGHFRVRMPGVPIKTSQSGSFGGARFTVHVAAVQSPYVAVVEGESITPNLPADQYDLTLRTAVASFRASIGMSVVRQSNTTFQGHKGRKAILKRDGTTYEFLVFIFSGRQTYAMFAPAGAEFDALAGSFEASA